MLVAFIIFIISTCLAIYCRVFFRGIQILQMEQEREFVKIIFTKQHWQKSLQYT